MPSIITIDKDWIEGIEKYLTLGAMVLSSGNIPIATAIGTTKILFEAWKAHNKSKILAQKRIIEAEEGLNNPIIPIEETKKPEIVEIFNQDILEPVEKKKKARKKHKRGSKHKDVENESRLKITIKTRKNMFNLEL